jgi:hypothetical protein
VAFLPRSQVDVRPIHDVSPLTEPAQRSDPKWIAAAGIVVS